MIRNYYTEAFKSGIVPVVSATQLIDGTVKSINPIAVAASPAHTAGVTMVLATVVPSIKVGQYVTAPAGVAAAWSINDHIIVEAVSSSATNTTITFNKFQAADVNQGFTFFNINQNSWKEFSLYIGTSPEQGNNFGSITSGTGNLAAAAQNTITIKVNNPYVQVGMSVYDDGALVGVIATVTNSTTFVLVAPLAANIVDASILTFAFTVLPSISVLTIDNQTVTFTNPAQGFVLPVSAVQITALTGGISNIIAVN